MPPRLAPSPGFRLNSGMKQLMRALFCLFCGVASAVAEGEARSTIPLSVRQGGFDGARLYAPVRIGGVLGSMRLDTGASTSRLALAGWNKDFPVLGASASQGASGVATQCDDVEIPGIALKASQGNDIARMRHEATRCPAGEDLLGLNFLRGARFSLDIAPGELSFFDAAPGDRRPRPFRLLGPEALLGVDARAGDAAIIGLFDTGAEICAVDRRFVEKHKKLFVPVAETGAAQDAGGKALASKVYKLKKLDLGEGRVFRDLYVLSYDFGALREALGGRTSFIFGANLLRKLRWDIDLTTKDAPSWDAKAK